MPAAKPRPLPALNGRESESDMDTAMTWHGAGYLDPHWNRTLPGSPGRPPGGLPGVRVFSAACFQIQMFFFTKAVLMMELVPKRHATSLYSKGQPVRTQQILMCILT